MDRRVLLLYCLLFFAPALSAQDYLTITGQVLDQEKGTPLAHAHVGIPEKGIGTTSGTGGAFTLKVPMRYANSTLLVSFIGYETYRQPISAIQGSVRIFLSPSPSELTEVVVMDEFAVENIIRRAVKRIPDNYPDHPTTVLGFYRESRAEDSLSYIYLAEGVLNIYKTSYRNSKEGMVSLVQGRKINLRDPLDTTFHSNFTSGHMAAHRFDFVKNRIDFIEEDFFDAYRYWLQGKTTYNDRAVYIIGFEPSDERQAHVETEEDDSILDIFNPFKSKKKKVITGRMRGRIFIEQDSYAFLRAEFEITPRGLKKINDYPLYAGNWHANSYVVNYRQLAGKWYFSDAVREGAYGGGGTYSNEVKITEINPEPAKPLPYLERLRRGDAFTQMTGEYDEDFWKAYNVTPLSEGLAESVRQLQTIRKAQEVFSEENMERLQRQRDSLQLLEARRLEAISQSEGEAAPSFDYEDYEAYLPPALQRRQRDFTRFKFASRLGAHVLTTDPGRLGITYLSDDGDAPQTVLSLEEEVPRRTFEVIGGFDLDYFLHKNFFVRGGFSFDFANSFYRERSIGAGAQLNLSRGRPFYLRAVAQYSNFRYQRKVGEASNDYGDFKVKNKKFNADRINLYYGSRTHNLKLSGELSLELNPALELFIRGAYFLPFSRRQEIRFRENRQLFRKKKRLPADDARVLITRNGMPFNGPIRTDESFTVTVGLLFF